MRNVYQARVILKVYLFEIEETQKRANKEKA